MKKGTGEVKALRYDSRGWLKRGDGTGQKIEVLFEGRIPLKASVRG